MEDKKVVLSVKDLNVKFTLRGQILHAIRGISLDVYQGESLAIVGESGSGKSVFVKCAMGLLDANGYIDGGSILYNGMDLTKFQTDKDWLKIRGKEIAMVFQDPMTSLNPLKTIGKQIQEAVELHQGLKGKDAYQAVLEVLSDVGIDDPERRYKQYLDANGYIDGGSILYNGMDLTKFQTDKDWLKIRGKEIAMVFQDPMTSLNPLKTIGKQIQEAVELHQGLKGKDAYQAVLEVLSDVGIDDPERRYKQYPHEFSGGMRQRVVIAIAVACRPKILICDEPTTALDVTIQAQILELIKAMQKKYDLTTIYITHDLGVVANVADRIAVMYAGDIVELGTCDEVFYDPRHPYTWALLSSLPQLGTKDEPLYSIQGTPPNLFHEVKGDAFAPRNPKALKIDFVERPPFFEVTPTHYARTWLMDPRAPKVEPPEHVRILREKGVNRVG